jgi:toxin CcdB
MPRFDVHAQPGHAQRLLLNVQADVLDRLPTRLVVPLFPLTGAMVVLRRLNPVFEIDRKRHAMMTEFMAPIPANRLGPPVATLADHFDIIGDALDMMFKGF